MRLVFILLVLSLAAPAWSFDLIRHGVPVPALSTGGVSKNAIPVLDNPDDQEAKTYPLDKLAPSAALFLTVSVGGTEVQIFFFPQSAFAYAVNRKGERLPSVMTYQATWLAFSPTRSSIPPRTEGF